MIAANNYLRAKYKPEDRSDAQQRKYRHSTFYGMELVQDTHRLALMNMLLHGIEGGIQFGDTLGEEGSHLPAATLTLSNPPFGTKVRHMDIVFLEKALETSPVVYSFHKSESKAFLERFAGQKNYPP